MFDIAIDGLWLHHHTQPDCKDDDDGKNACPYCPARIGNKGTKEESITQLYTCVNFWIVCPGGLRLPLYVHILKTEQLPSKEAVIHKDHKQEYKLQSATAVLPHLKKQFQDFLFEH